MTSVLIFGDVYYGHNNTGIKLQLPLHPPQTPTSVDFIINFIIIPHYFLFGSQRVIAILLCLLNISDSVFFLGGGVVRGQYPFALCFSFQLSSFFHAVICFNMPMQTILMRETWVFHPCSDNC